MKKYPVGACCWRVVWLQKWLTSGATDCFRASGTAQHVRRTPTSATVAAHNWYDCPLSSTGILAFLCPCYVFGKNAEQLGESCILYALSQFVPLLDIFCRTSVRGKIRERKKIKGSLPEDLVCHFVWCLSPCALTQEARVRTHALYNLKKPISRWPGFTSKRPCILCFALPTPRRSYKRQEVKAWLANKLQRANKIESVIAV